MHERQRSSRSIERFDDSASRRSTCSESFAAAMQAAIDAQAARSERSVERARHALRLAAAAGVPGRAVSESQFAFLEAEFADEFAMAEWAERHALSDPGPAVIYARKALESGVKWVVPVRPVAAAAVRGSAQRLPERAGVQGAGRTVTCSTWRRRSSGPGIGRCTSRSRRRSWRRSRSSRRCSSSASGWRSPTAGRPSRTRRCKFDPHKLTADRLAAEKASLAERQELEERLEREAEESRAGPPAGG